MTPEIGVQATSFCASLPRSETAPTSIGHDFAVLAETFPGHAEQLSLLTDRVAAQVSGLPAVARHGDLWSGNLLVAGRRLTGVLDWDAWHPAAVPGTDLLHLVATEEAHRTHRSLGSVWMDRPWLGEVYRRLGQEYWRSLRVRPRPEELEAVGIAWWASTLSFSPGVPAGPICSWAWKIPPRGV